jgi:hypothetical protein
MCFRTSNLRYIDYKDEENNIVIQNNFNAVINGDFKVRKQTVQWDIQKNL